MHQRVLYRSVAASGVQHPRLQIKLPVHNDFEPASCNACPGLARLVCDNVSEHAQEEQSASCATRLVDLKATKPTRDCPGPRCIRHQLPEGTPVVGCCSHISPICDAATHVSDLQRAYNHACESQVDLSVACIPAAARVQAAYPVAATRQVGGTRRPRALRDRRCIGASAAASYGIRDAQS